MSTTWRRWSAGSATGVPVMPTARDPPRAKAEPDTGVPMATGPQMMWVRSWPRAVPGRRLRLTERRRSPRELLVVRQRQETAVESPLHRTKALPVAPRFLERPERVRPMGQVPLVAFVIRPVLQCRIRHARRHPRHPADGRAARAAWALARSPTGRPAQRPGVPLGPRALRLWHARLAPGAMAGAGGSTRGGATPARWRICTRAGVAFGASVMCLASCQPRTLDRGTGRRPPSP